MSINYTKTPQCKSPFKSIWQFSNQHEDGQSDTIKLTGKFSQLFVANTPKLWNSKDIYRVTCHVCQKYRTCFLADQNNSMNKNPPYKADSSIGNQENPHLVWHLKTNFRLYYKLSKASQPQTTRLHTISSTYILVYVMLK